MPGTGKAQPIDTIIPTPQGEKQLKELKVGDYVFDRLGQPTKILGIYPQGKIDCYKIDFSDSRSTLCAGDHLWSYYSSKGNLISKTALEMLNSGLKNACGYKYRIPANQAVEYPEKDFKIDPYMMGVFLGDGCCKEKYLSLSSETEEIPSYIGQIIKAKPVKNSDRNYTWTFEWLEEEDFKNVSWIGGNGSKRSCLRRKPKTEDYFLSYKDDLMVPAYEKNIPVEYKYGSIEQRYQLIQGLMDTDGCIHREDGHHRYCVDFTSTSLKLINSMRDILWSLGYRSSIGYDRKEEKYTNGVCYRLFINIPNEEKYKLFRLTKKKAIAEQAGIFHKKKDYSKISITNIQKIEEQKEMLCIYVDNPEHLYLTNDYIVTHNTTLVKFIISALSQYGVDPEKDVVYTSFTGKATQVLQKKGNKNVSTLHKLLFKSHMNKDGSFYRQVVEGIKYKVVVVDEVSMVPIELVQILKRFPGVYVLYLGDPFQLPSIRKEDDNHLLDNPHIFLKDVMRQAADSEIIQLSMKIRNGEPIPKMTGKDVQVIDKSELNTGMLLWADQILCATNATRQALNTQVRDLLGRGGGPQDGDKVICLQNYWDDTSIENELPLVNGTIGFLRNPKDEKIVVPSEVKYFKQRRYTSLRAGFETDVGESYPELLMDKKMILEGEPTLEIGDIYKFTKKPGIAFKDLQPKSFTYGYAITGHKSQRQ